MASWGFHDLWTIHQSFFFSFDFIIKPRLRIVSGSPSLIESQNHDYNKKYEFEGSIMYEKCVRNSHSARLKIVVIYSVEHKINLAFGF